MPALVKALRQRDRSITTVVVLPEYDRTIFPNPLNPDILNNYSDRDALLREDLSNVYFVGTQDAFHSDVRYTQNYMVNGRLDFVQKQSKQFLVPGGEYIIGWADAIFQRIDPETAGAFRRSRGRYVVSNETLRKETVNDNQASLIGIGACSSALFPASFQSSVNNGARALAINISYEQFRETRQYESFANRNMQFMTHSYGVTVVAGVDYGAARVFQLSGATSYSGDDGVLASYTETTQRKSLYAQLGDGGILLMLGLPIAAYLSRESRRRSAK
jgi:apolipoprotein N-acyltransferase